MLRTRRAEQLYFKNVWRHQGIKSVKNQGAKILEKKETQGDGHCIWVSGASRRGGWEAEKFNRGWQIHEVKEKNLESETTKEEDPSTPLRFG